MNETRWEDFGDDSIHDCLTGLLECVGLSVEVSNEIRGDNSREAMIKVVEALEIVVKAKEQIETLGIEVSCKI